MTFSAIEPLGGDTVMTEQPLKLHSLEDVIAWAQSHHAEVRAYWSEQRRKNADNDQRTISCQTFMTAEIKELRRDVQQIRSRIFYAMGAASMLGGIIAVAATAFLKV